mgnify:CR=1 FL=1
MTKEQAINLLVEKANQLGRLPKKSDFTGVEISKIKAKLGPWTRALEQAGLKEKSPLHEAKLERIKQKRIQKKEAKNEKN